MKAVAGDPFFGGRRPFYLVVVLIVFLQPSRTRGTGHRWPATDGVFFEAIVRQGCIKIAVAGGGGNNPTLIFRNSDRGSRPPLKLLNIFRRALR